MFLYARPGNQIVSGLLTGEVLSVRREGENRFATVRWPSGAITEVNLKEEYFASKVAQELYVKRLEIQYEMRSKK